MANPFTSSTCRLVPRTMMRSPRPSGTIVGRLASGSVLNSDINCVEISFAAPGVTGRTANSGLSGANRASVLATVADLSDDDLPAVLSNLGGHDLQALTTTLDFIGQDLSRPTVLFAYTIKGWGLPIAGDPLNHSKLLSNEQMDEFREQIAVWDERARKLFHERPLVAVGGALVAGYLLGRLFSRRWP